MIFGNDEEPFRKFFYKIHDIVLNRSEKIDNNPVQGDMISYQSGDSITMMCNAEGFPRPHVHWRKGLLC